MEGQTESNGGSTIVVWRRRSCSEYERGRGDEVCFCDKVNVCLFVGILDVFCLLWTRSTLKWMNDCELWPFDGSINGVSMMTVSE